MGRGRQSDPYRDQKRKIAESVRSALREKAKMSRLPWRKRAYREFAESGDVRTIVGAVHRHVARGLTTAEVEDLAKRFSIKAATKTRKKYSIQMPFGEGHSMKIKKGSGGVSTELTLREVMPYAR